MAEPMPGRGAAGGEAGPAPGWCPLPVDTTAECCSTRALPLAPDAWPPLLREPWAARGAQVSAPVTTCQPRVAMT